MITTCPSCATRFRVDDALLGRGRRVRCSACGSVWHQVPETPVRVAPAALPEDDGDDWMSSAPSSSSFADLAAAMERETAYDTLTMAEEAPAPLSLGRLRPATPAPAPEAKPRRLSAALRWGALAVVIVGGVTGLAVERDAVVAAWPAAARLYDTFGFGVEPPGTGLEMVDSKTEFRDVEGTSMLFVDITVQNKSDRQRDVPDLMASALGADGKPFQRWRMQPKARRLFPGEKTVYHGNIVEKGGQAAQIRPEFVLPN
ncbi:zinc-ribbon domain-containing protein [Nitrospirillum sp. BR 11163]|uniref:zinc-ribbon domain-containing protein n=1 Tax=Nitrospirillum sp. BR 11163 TaxID=3104323 RepID=UPI002B000714|nr:zinc-ribbon domain-containing protein [Nitrospirillum sp. BR 11163]MEA1675441.1 zinc-ribbon domain-containing protein [Nitrospirillum sp. BR 11163]